MHPFSFQLVCKPSIRSSLRTGNHAGIVVDDDGEVADVEEMAADKVNLEADAENKEDDENSDDGDEVNNDSDGDVDDNTNNVIVEGTMLTDNDNTGIRVRRTKPINWKDRLKQPIVIHDVASASSLSKSAPGAPRGKQAKQKN